MARGPCASIAGVRPGSIAAALGLKAGDCLLSLNGAPVRDQLDYRFQMADARACLTVRRGDRKMSFEVEKAEGEELGLEFAEATFDGIRRCRNRCLFCFVDRQPPGLRPGLYVKDDDYRYSFLFGSFVTLTNLDGEDWRRISEQRLSPLYVSVHATDLAVRRRLLGNPHAPDILAQIRRLAESRIRVQAQVVLCPGINDGDVLERTLADLSALHECVQSVAVVPVGLTRYKPPDGPRSLTIEEMVATVRQVRRWQRRLRPALGRTFVYLGDEFYLRTGTPIPSARAYDGFPQYENGIGLARVLLDQWARVRHRLQPSSAEASLSLVTGELAAPMLRRFATEMADRAGTKVHVVAVRNSFFGPSVNVAGLLTAADVVEALRAAEPLGTVVLPRAMFDAGGERTLDGVSTWDISKALERRVVVARSASDLVRLAIEDGRNR